jgi:hypothetical protein
MRKPWVKSGMSRPTDCRSAAASAVRHRVQKTTISREAVGWNGGLGGLATDARLPQRHDRTTLARYHGCTTSVHPNHAQHTIAPSTTGVPHDGRSNYASTTSTGTTEKAQRA